jgi:hypothetical protein
VYNPNFRICVLAIKRFQQPCKYIVPNLIIIIIMMMIIIIIIINILFLLRDFVQRKVSQERNYHVILEMTV